LKDQNLPHSIYPAANKLPRKRAKKGPASQT